MQHLFEYLVNNHTKKDLNPFKTDADNVVYVHTLGKLSKSGRMEGIKGSLWDKTNSEGAELFGDTWNILVGPAGCLKEGDTIITVDSKTHRKLPGYLDKVEFVCPCTYEDFVKIYTKIYPKIIDRWGKIPFQKITTMHAIDHVDVVDHSNDKPKKVVEEKPMKTWLVTYNQQTPMGLSGSHEYTAKVYAKTYKGALGEYKRKYYQGPSSAYATELIKIEEEV